MKFVEFSHFMTAYLSADENANAVRALATFARRDPAAFDRMRGELRELLSVSVDQSQLQEIFRTQGMFRLPDRPGAGHQMLMDLFYHSETLSHPNSPSKPYDVFVSYSSQDRLFASHLARELEDIGYVVWLDAWEVLVGHNIVDEVYKGITGAKFVVVLLSTASCQSQWVKEEFTTALTSEIEERQVSILPVKIEDCKIPASLRNKRYANFTESWDDGFRELTTAIDLHQAEGARNRPSDPRQETSRTAPGFSELDRWRDSLVPDVVSAGFTVGQGYKDTLIGPIEGRAIDVEKTRLQPLVDAARVRLQRWGGPSFPYDKLPSTTEHRLADGLRYVDTKPWPYRSESFHLWQIDSQLRFLQRHGIDEDFCWNESGQFFMRGRLARSWALIDIVTPLLFARNILTHETELRSLGVKFLWGGLSDRGLIELSQNRFGFARDYRCREEEWNFETEVFNGFDIAAEARKAALDLFWLFGWDTAVGVLDRDLESLASGSLPD